MTLTQSFISRPLICRIAIAAIVIGGVGSDSLGQSISQTKSPAESLQNRRLPNPIRQAAHSERIDSSSSISESAPVDNPYRGNETEVAESAWGMDSGNPFDSIVGGIDPTPKHAHQILRAPKVLSTGKKSTLGHHPVDPPGRLVHPPFSSHRRRVQPAPPTLPGANQRETWKTPYSYGYFGASGTRHWSLHHGARDRYTEWVLQ